MKTLKLTIATFALIAMAATTKAKTIATEERPLSQFHAVNTYVDAFTQGRLNDFEQVVDNTAKFSVLRNKKILSYDKQQMFMFLQQNKNVEQNCTITTGIVSSNADMAVVKVDMQYDNLVKSSYLTLINNGKDWKITDVYTVFK